MKKSLLLSFLMLLGLSFTAIGEISGKDTLEYPMKEISRPLRAKISSTGEYLPFPWICDSTGSMSISSISCLEYWKNETEKFCSENNSAGEQCLIFLDKTIKKTCEEKQSNYEKELCKCGLDSVYQSFGEDVYKLYAFSSLKRYEQHKKDKNLITVFENMPNYLIEIQPLERRKIFNSLAQDACRFPISDSGEMYGPNRYYKK